MSVLVVAGWDSFALYIVDIKLAKITLGGAELPANKTGLVAG